MPLREELATLPGLGQGQERWWAGWVAASALLAAFWSDAGLALRREQQQQQQVEQERVRGQPRMDAEEVLQGTPPPGLPGPR